MYDWVKGELRKTMERGQNRSFSCDHENDYIRMADANVLSDSEMDAEFEKGYAAMREGRTKSVKAAFAGIRNDYAL
ncbi:MAG: hypothetical protein IKI12_00430 [Lachnospiraceae bacterium]|nr:hypothetical protein [Lachnospiraceae bacterium]